MSAGTQSGSPLHDLTCRFTINVAYVTVDENWGFWQIHDAFLCPAHLHFWDKGGQPRQPHPCHSVTQHQDLKRPSRDPSTFLLCVGAEWAAGQCGPAGPGLSGFSRSVPSPGNPSTLASGVAGKPSRDVRSTSCPCTRQLPCVQVEGLPWFPGPRTLKGGLSRKDT